jgi:tetratricopeptide (TPR) repeat protein
MLDDKYIALLDDYLDGNLSPAESDELLAEVESNPELKELMGILALTRESIRMTGYKQTIKKVHEDVKKEASQNASEIKEVKLNPLRWWLGIAASLTLLLLVGNYWVQSLPNSLYEEKYMAYEIPTMRSSGQEIDKIEGDFKIKNWDSVVKAVSIQETNSEILFLAGVSHFELGDYSNAEIYLEKVKEINVKSEVKLFGDETDYYLFLSYLKSEKYPEAKTILTRISSDPNHTYYGSFGFRDKVKLYTLALLHP